MLICFSSMIEGFTILVVAGLAAGLYLFSHAHREVARRDPAGEIERLRHSLAWLESRRRRAEEKHHGAEMKAQIDHELHEMRQRLADLQAALPGRDGAGKIPPETAR